MSVEKHRHFLVKGGSAKAHLDEIEAKRHERFKALNAIKDEVGAEHIIESGMSVGFTFKSDPPKNWRRHPHIGNFEAYIPKKNSKAGKTMFQRITDANKIWKYDKAAGGFFTGETWEMYYEDGKSYMSRPSYGFVGETPVVSIHRAATKAKPIEGLVEIKASEYLRMKEEIEETKQSA